MSVEPLSVRGGVVHGAIASIAALWLWTAIVYGAGAQETRTWSDSTGKYKVQAKFVDVSDGKVTLEKEDGTQLSIPLERLSEADQKVVAETKAGQDNPFQEMKPGRKSARRKKAEEEPEEDQAEAVRGEAKTVVPRWKGVKQVLPAAAGDAWKLAIEAPQQPAARRGRPIAIPPKTDFFERAKTLAINPICRRAVIGYLGERPGQSGSGRTRLVLCDLEKGQTLGAGWTPGKMVLLALNDSGTQVLMRREEFGFGSQDRLETWDLTKSGITRVLQWIPHDDAQRTARDIKWARYFGEDRLVTLSAGGKLTVWDSSLAKPLYWLEVQGGCYPALSPDRRYLAFATAKEIGVLDLTAGEVVALQAAPKEHFPFPVFAFTPKGTRLVCASFNRIYCWDAASGSLYRDISLVGLHTHIGENVLCPSEQHVLVGNSLLIDIETQAKLWTYRGHELAGMLGAVCWFVVPGQAAGALVPAVLPQPSAVEKIQKAMDSPDFFVLKPGAAVKLNVSALPDPGEREKAGAALAEKLKANGFQVGPAGVVELVASTEMGKRREVGYRSFGQIGIRIYQVQEYHSRVKFLYQGQTAWELSGSSVPGFIQLKKDETMEQVLRRSERPNYEWFSKVELPKILQKPTAGAATLGVSQVTISGVP